MPVDPSELPEGCPPLNSYYVYLTAGCNLACAHCWLAPSFQQHGGTGGHLDYGLFALAIEEGLPLGLSHINMTGGEPLLHPDFIRMVDLVREKGLRLTIETNGTLMTQSLAQYLRDKSTLGPISISLDGAGPETHDAWRGVKGSFEKACLAVRYLVSVGYRPQVIMSVHAGNIDEVERVVQLAERLGAGSVKLGIAQSLGRGERLGKRNQLLDLRNLIELGRWVDDYLQMRVSIPVYYNWHMAFHKLKNLMNCDGCTCNIFGSLGILPTGHVAMCGIGELVADLCYGLLGEDPVREVWTFHPMLVELRKAVPAGLEGICGDCLIHNKCLGACVAQNYYRTRRLTAPYWFCQESAEAGLFPFSRRRSCA